MASRLDNPPSDLPAGYTLHAGFPSVSEYRNLRKSSGLTPVTEAQAAGAVTGSLYGCHITYSSGSESEAASPPSAGLLNKSQAVAMGRIIGDGGWYFHIADMATLPEHQRKGLGSVVLKHLLAYVKDNSPEDGEPYITLFADPPGRRLYERNGFVESVTLKEVGMVLAGEK